jgi:hypothetical protein
MASKREIEQLVQDALEIQDHPQSKTNELSFDAALIVAALLRENGGVNTNRCS